MAKAKYPLYFIRPYFTVKISSGQLLLLERTNIFTMHYYAINYIGFLFYISPVSTLSLNYSHFKRSHKKSLGNICIDSNMMFYVDACYKLQHKFLFFFKKNNLNNIDSSLLIQSKCKKTHAIILIKSTRK